MIDLKEMKVNLANNEGEIIRFDTWWLTPFGMVSDLGIAKEKLDSMDMSYDIIRPITVAVCSNGLYEPWV